MADQTPLLALPYILPSQAQKHVTHNEALVQLDAIVQLAAADRDLTAPPVSPVIGERHIVASGGTSEWQGHDGEIALYLDAGWVFATPQIGWRAWIEAEQAMRIFDGSAWVAMPLDLDNLPGVGINTTSDANNRLAVSAAATLLSHEGNGHQLKINKYAAADTASLLFQTSWSGRAEMGVVGDDDFAIKVSADGATWHEAVRFDAASGHVAGEAVQQSASDVTTGRLMRADFGYCPGNLLGSVSQSGGLPTGAVIESGSTTNGDYLRLADGTQICFASVGAGSITAAGSGTWADPYRTAGQTWIFPISFIDTPVVQATAIPPASVSAARRICCADIGVSDATGTLQVTAIRIGSDSTADDFSIGLVAVGRWY